MNSGSVLGTHETNLDFVRALAVLMVVGAHLGWFLGDVHISFLEPSLLGRLGVVIFFVHSGIVNMLSIERHVHKHGEHRLFRAFMTRRSFRIYPLSVFVVSIIYLTHIPVAHINAWSATLGNHPRAELLPSLLLVQNFVQFDQIVGPLWSLPYEIQMYCLFPLIYLVLRRFYSARILVFVWALLAAVEHAIGAHLAKHGNLGHIFALPDMLYYFLWFLAGLYAYKEMQTSKRTLPFLVLPALLGFLCLICSLSYDRNKFIFISLCLGLALPYIQSCEIGPVNLASAWVAKYSYGIYLLHDPAIWLGFVRFGHFPMVVRGSIFLITTFGGSVLLYRVIEHPMIVIGNKAAAAISRKRILAKAHAATAMAGAAG
ncbi:MAG: acyltransferase [Terriglobales bacterium]